MITIQKDIDKVINENTVIVIPEELLTVLKGIKQKCNYYCRTKSKIHGARN